MPAAGSVTVSLAFGCRQSTIAWVSARGVKYSHERETRTLKPERIVPEHCSWQTLLDADGDDLAVTYRHILERLGRQPGTLGVIFRKAQDPRPEVDKRLPRQVVASSASARPG